MSEKIMNYLGLAIIFGILGVAIAALLYVNSYSQSIDPGTTRNFTVTGEGKSVAVPDIAEFIFSVITEGGTDIAGIQKQNVDKVNRAINFLKENGVDAKDIRTTGYNVSPRYSYSSCPPVFSEGRDAVVCPPPKITGYTIDQTVQVKVRDFAKVGELLSGVVDQGANSVSQLNFTVDDRSGYENQARAEAIQKAKEKAVALAKAGGFHLGRLLSIDEGSSPIPYYGDVGFGGGPSAVKEAAPVIEPGSQEITVSVSLRYEIK